MNRVLREAKRIIRRAQADGYDGDFAILRESVMEDIQLTCGRTIAENVMYQKVIEQLMKGHSICEYCEDNLECKGKQSAAWLKGYCHEFMLRFPTDEDAVGAFNELYMKCEGKRDGIQNI